MLWSDPDEVIQRFADSHRGSSVVYGPLAVKQFLQATGLRGIIRGHQCVDGIAQSRGMPVWTVFSASNHKPGTPNKAGVMIIREGTMLSSETFPGISPRTRQHCMFFSVGRAEGRPQPPPGALWTRRVCQC
jgi:hypothetical protein